MSIIIFDINVFGQERNVTSPVVVPSSPTTYSFAVRGNIPQDNSSGAFSYVIPIYTIQDHDISHNIDLSYYSSGVKVDEIAGNTGMGWSLGAGGIISRVLRGKPDEQVNRWFPSSISEVQHQQIRINSIIDPISPANYDVERDWFNFNVNGISGTFYFDENLGVHVQSKEQLEVSYQAGSSGDNIGYGTTSTFTIKDGKGYTYIFGGTNEYLEGMRYYSNCSPGAEQYYSAWFLREIISPVQNKIAFTYIENIMTYSLSKESSWLFDRACSLSPSSPMIEYDINFNECISYSKIRSRSLSKISFNGGEINFNYNYQRVDNGGHSISDINIRNNIGEVIKTVDFSYNVAPSGNSGAADRYRLFLMGLVLKSADGTIKEPYSFDYHNIDLLPSRLSYNKDKFGYYNGSNNSTPFSKTLKEDPLIFNILNKTSLNYATADREVKADLVQTGMLKSITYPTGGSSLINYEAHKTEKTVKEINYSNSSLYYIRNCKQDNTNSTLRFISNGSDLNFSVGASLDHGVSNLGCTAPIADDIHDIYTLNIVDLTTGTTIFSSTGDYGNNMKTVTPCTQQSGDYVYETCPVKTVNGHQYEVKLIFGSKYFNAFRGQIDLKYNGVEVPVKKLIYYGGARVQEIKDFDGTTYFNNRKFYYNELTKILADSSTLYEVYEPQEYRLIRYTKHCIWYGEDRIDDPPTYKSYDNAMKLSISSSSANVLFSNRKNMVNYETITEVLENSQLNSGAIQRTFYRAIDAAPAVYQGQSYIGMPYSNSMEHFNGRLKEEQIFKINSGRYSLTKKRIFDYTFITKEVLHSWFFIRDYDLFQQLSTDISNVSIGYYLNYITLLTNEKITEQDFGGASPVINSSEKDYITSPYYNLRTEVRTTSNGQLRFVKYKYASDFVNQRDYMTNLIAKKRVSEPVVVELGKKIGQAETIYETNEFVYAAFPGLVDTQPKVNIKTLDRQFPKTIYTINKYTSKGKVEELVKDEVVFTYLWGYGGQYPIAEIKNATYDDVFGVLGQATINSLNAITVSETTINNAMTALRNHTDLSKAMVTSYTYKPLIGMTSKTDERGVTEYYQYDGMQRLKAVLDQMKNVTTSMDYRYRTN